MDLRYRETILELEQAVETLPAGVAETVKSAGVEELMGVDLPAASFADPVTRRYPYHTPAATLASLARVKQATAELGQIRADMLTSVLRTKAARFGLTEEAEFVGDAVDTRPEAQECDDPLPVNFAEAEAAVKQAIAYPREFDLTYKAALASRVLTSFPEAAGDKRAELQRWAGRGVFDQEAIAMALSDRAEIHKSAGRKDEALACAELGLYIAENRVPRHDLTKVAAAVDRMDRETGLYGFEGVLPAEQFCRYAQEDLEKLSEDLVETKSGTVFSKSAMAQVDANRIRELFGEDYFRELCDYGLFFNVEKVAAAIENSDRGGEKLWKKLIPSLT